MFGRFARFSPKKYSVQKKKSFVIPSMNSEV